MRLVSKSDQKETDQTGILAKLGGEEAQRDLSDNQSPILESFRKYDYLIAKVYTVCQ